MENLSNREKLEQALKLYNEVIKEEKAEYEAIKDKSVSNVFNAVFHLKMLVGACDNENFACLFLDNQNRLICGEILFAGTVNSCPVHVREIVRRALKHNAAAIILGHNHPSGIIDPSPADRAITSKIKSVLEIIDIRLEDHIIIGKGDFYSFAENGFI